MLWNKINYMVFFRKRNKKDKVCYNGLVFEIIEFRRIKLILNL